MKEIIKRRFKSVNSRRAGFALLAVIWGTGLIATLIVSFTTTSRLRLQTAHNIASATKAGYIAESAINLAALSLLAAREGGLLPAAPTKVYDGQPNFCVLDDAAVAVAVEEEGGKIDLNAATPELLMAALTGLGLDDRAGKAIAGAIVIFRTVPAVDNGQIKPALTSETSIEQKMAPFETVMELDQVAGVTPDLFRKLIPFITVHSRSQGLDPQASPPALFAALAGYPPADVDRLAATPYPNDLKRDDPRFPAALRQMSDHNAFLIHAEALLATGQIATREAIFNTRPADGKQFAFQERRNGQARFVASLRALMATNGPHGADCAS